MEIKNWIITYSMYQLRPHDSRILRHATLIRSTVREELFTTIRIGANLKNLDKYGL